MITHLRLTYGQISQVELNLNYTRMQVKWNPLTPIESLYMQLSEGVVTALEGWEEIQETTVMRIGYNIIANTGLFKEGCRD